MSKEVLIPIANGTEELEAVCIADTLVRAGCRVTIASVEDTLQVTAGRNTKLVADRLISQCTDTDYDLIVLPGGMPGAEHLRDCAALIEKLRSQAAAGRLYGAICASPAVVLQAHGLLKNKKAACYPSMADQLDNFVDKDVVVDANCITSRGPGTAIKFALVLIEVLFDRSTAEKVASGMLVNY